MILEDFHPAILHAGKVEQFSGWNYHEVSSPFARLYCITEGCASLRIAGRTYQLRPGHLYIVPPFTRHDNICDAPFTHYYIHFYEDNSSAEFSGSIFDRYDFPVEVPSRDIDRLMFSRIVEMHPTLSLDELDPDSYNDKVPLIRNISSDSGRALSLRMESQGAMLFLMSRFLCHARPRRYAEDERVQRAISYIFSNLSDPDMDVETLSREACLSVNQFIRAFRKHTGMTPLKFMTAKRMERAQLLLLEKDLGNKDLAYAVGYEDPAYFCKVFRNTVGIPPQQYKSKAFPASVSRRD
ncbi:MAG: AraC family transcriptional regulator [Bacteroidales bacterium]|nr:helix-turn-helix domain-containing protein [Candidatus Cryptobacteroides choladohippi]MCQ2178494.1 AraC family transcriptional regulator [Bacteroidales bacterium]